MARYENANQIINDAALEVGLIPVDDPFSSQDEAFIQLRGLLTGAGRELVDMHNWTVLVNNFSVTVQPGDSGDYPLPDDFNRMINQTGWDQGNNLPVGGPLSAQDWTYLEGRDLASTTIYASFRLEDGIFRIFPQPPPESLVISFEYISGNWVQEVSQLKTAPGVKDRPTTGTDIVLFQPVMMVKMLKMQFLAAKGFDNSAGVGEFMRLFNARTGQDAGASILSASNANSVYPYLSGYRNVGDTRYGM
jgi:hypothetical protein